MKRLSAASSVAATTVLSLLFASSSYAQVATYHFNNNLNADQGGVAALTAVDPLGANSFGSAFIYGGNRTIYNFVGNATPVTQQAGLSLDTTGLVATNDYSAELVFEFTQRNGAWRRILDVQDRQSDNGFYVNPSNNLDVFPVAGSSTGFTTGVFHHVVLTNNAGTVNGYLDGNFEFSSSTTVMDINNAGNLMNLFLDNVVGGGQGEYSSGSIALFRLYNSALTSGDVATLAANPFGTAAPEPGSVALLGIGVIPILGMVRRRAR